MPPAGPFPPQPFYNQMGFGPGLAMGMPPQGMPGRPSPARPAGVMSYAQPYSPGIPSPVQRQQSFGSTARVRAVSPAKEVPQVSVKPPTEVTLIDPSCWGVRTLSYGVENGFESLDGGRTFTKVGYEYAALLVSAQGFTSGVHYFEIVDCTNDDSEIGFRIGCVPRMATVGLDLDSDILENHGVGVRVIHGKDLQYGDRVGILVDLGSGGQPKAELKFFKNGSFLHIPVTLPLANPGRTPVYFAIASAGRPNSELSFALVPSPSIPDLKAYDAAVQQHKPVIPKALVVTPAVLAIAQAHVGNTVEISSQLHEELRLRQGDAILFVDTGAPGKAQLWQFEIDAEDVIAQDLFYEHAELDLHTQAAEVQLKYAFKFVALRPGTTVFKAGYGPPGATAWVQKLKVVVVPPSY